MSIENKLKSAILANAKRYDEYCANGDEALFAAEFCEPVEEDWETDSFDEEWTRSTLAWLDDPANWGDENYSDIYKELYGFRP